MTLLTLSMPLGTIIMVFFWIENIERDWEALLCVGLPGRFTWWQESANIFLGNWKWCWAISGLLLISGFLLVRHKLFLKQNSMINLTSNHHIFKKQQSVTRIRPEGGPNPEVGPKMVFGVGDPNWGLGNLTVVVLALPTWYVSDCDTGERLLH